jgi:hypothetical protein
LTVGEVGAVDVARLAEDLVLVGCCAVDGVDERVAHARARERRERAALGAPARDGAQEGDARLLGDVLAIEPVGQPQPVHRAVDERAEAREQLLARARVVVLGSSQQRALDERAGRGWRHRAGHVPGRGDEH